MGILIGMDEAGYGPNYGPLVVAATAWEVGEEAGSHPEGTRQGAGSQELRIAAPRGYPGLRIGEPASQSAIRNPQSEIEYDLYRPLRNIVSKSASERRIGIADSKVLYQPGAGLRQLERGVHAVLLALRQSLGSWSQIVACCQADRDGHHHRLCWHEGFNCGLPVDAAADELVRLGARLARACDAAGVRPVAIRASLVFPAQFNELVEYYGTKGAALSHVTVGLFRDVVDAVCTPAEAGAPSAPVYAVCDKHGGRNFYAALLQHHFSDHWIEPVYESHAESRYEWGPPEAHVHATFRMNGERFLPTALASMTAKYLRELSMRAFNEFWCARVPDLRPTAGYPMDSHRFRKAIAAAQRELGIDDHVLWRKR